MFDNWEVGKGTRIWICQTGSSLSLWLGLHTNEYWSKKVSEKKALQLWPYEIHSTCRCRNCRYIRMYRRNQTRMSEVEKHSSTNEELEE